MKPINKVLKIKDLIKDPFLEYPNLSFNEKMIGKLAIMGYSDQKISKAIDMPLGTVRFHLRSVCKVMGCKKSELSGKLIEKIKAILDEPSD